MLPPEALDAARRTAEQAPPMGARQRATVAALLAPAVDQLRRRRGAA
jgi:hypothetical protein